MSDQTEDIALDTVELATELTIAWLGNPNTRATAEEAATFLKTLHGSIGELAGKSEAPAPSAVEPEYTPAVPVRSSVKPDYIVSLIDGRKLKSLRRHLATHGLTPDDYRARYGLKADYPMVAATYAETRRELAKKIGLGRSGRGGRPAKATAPAVKPAAKPAARGRKPGA